MSVCVACPCSSMDKKRRGIREVSIAMRLSVSFFLELYELI